MKKHYREDLEKIPGFNKKGLYAEVRLKKNKQGVLESDIDTALRILKKKINKEGILKELRRNEYYESKGQRNRREKAEAIRRHKKMLREEALNEV